LGDINLETFKSILNSFYYPLVVAIIGGVIVGTFLNKRPSWSEILNFIKAHPNEVYPLSRTTLIFRGVR
jgi:hypothetical protein